MKTKKTFTFDVVGDGKTIFCGKFNAIDQEHALVEARKLCKTLRNWELVCRETGSSFKAGI